MQAVLKEMELNIEAIGSLKITGELNDEDFISIRLMTNLKNLDISEVNITALPTRAFHASENVENLILPNTLTTIGSKMFAESTLKFVIIPVGVTTIEQAAFEKCTALTSIEIPASVETIGDSAFMGCSKLATVTFEKGSQLKTIGGRYGSGAFANCTALTAIEIPASVETIEATAFKRCSSLATVTFEKGSQLKTIGGGYYYSAYEKSYYSHGAFSDCIALASIEIPASVETIEAAAFAFCSSLKTVTFEKGSKLTTIGGGWEADFGAFGCLRSLVTVDMSECTKVKEIGDRAFAGRIGTDSYASLQLFKIGTEVPPKFGYDVFHNGVRDYAVLKVPSGCIDAYKAAAGCYIFASITELDE